MHVQLANGAKLNLSVDAPKRVKLKGSARRDAVDDSSMTPSSEDPLRILAPGQKKLSTIESQRVLAVMEEAIKRMNNAMLIPTLASALEGYSVSLGVELVEMLRDYNHLTELYNRLYSELERGGSLPDLNDSNDSSDMYTLGMDSRELGITGSGSGSPAQMESPEEGPQAPEDRFQQVRFKLKHNVKCILRGLHRNPSAASVLPATPKNLALLQEEMG